MTQDAKPGLRRTRTRRRALPGARAGAALLLLAGLAAGAAVAQPGELVRMDLANGRYWQGRVIGENPREVLLQTVNGPIAIPRESILRMAPLAPRPTQVAAVGAAPALAAAARTARLGAGTPRLAPGEQAGSLRLTAEGGVAEALLPTLLADYGRDVGLASVRADLAGAGGEQVFELSTAESARLVRAAVTPRGPAQALREMMQERSDIAVLTRRLGEFDPRALRESGIDPRRGLTEAVVALSAVAVIVHQDNPLRAPSLAQLRGLFSGAIARWSEVGGPAAPVNVYVLDDRSSATETLRERVLGAQGRIAGTARVLGSPEDLADAVAADPLGIGIVDVASIRNTRALALKLSCGIVASPGRFQIASEEYPLARRVLFYAGAGASPLVRDFMAYAVSDRGQASVATSGLVDLVPQLSSAEEAAAQLAAAGAALPAELRAVAQPDIAAFQRVVAGARRLSITFRFDVGRHEPDARAEEDMNRLARWARAAENAARQIILVGHASVDGNYQANVTLSRVRAQTVATRLRGLGVNVARVESVGPASPVMCPEDAGEIDNNRRVEVWIQ